MVCLPTATTRKLREAPDLNAALHHRFPKEGQRCTYAADCEQAEKLFKSQRAYKKHLTQDHSVPDDEVGLHMTGAEIMPFHPTACLYPQCASGAMIYPTPASYSRHLNRIHKVGQGDRTKYWLSSVQHHGVGR